MIRLATEQEAIGILNEPQNVARIGVVAENLKYQPWIAQDGKFRLMFLFWHVEGDTFEVHVASPLDSIIKSRQLAKEIMEWLFSHGANRLITACPNGKVKNFALKIGMKPYQSDGGTTYLEALTWL